VFGHAAEMGNKPDSFWRWIGERVVKPLAKMGYPIDLAEVAPTTGSDGYGTNGTVRMSRSEWRSFGGVCGHANVPDNSHWDPGPARLDLVARYARGQSVPTPTPTPSPSRSAANMPYIASRNGTHRLVEGGTCPPIDATAVKAAVAQGVPVIPFSEASWDHLLGQCGEALGRDIVAAIKRAAEQG
jgi:hypothetical protein